MRSLKILSIDDNDIISNLCEAEKSMQTTLNKSESDNNIIGSYCCGKCTVSFWRALNVGLFDRKEERLEEGMRILKKNRKNKSEWSRFPFFYTLSALNEIKFDLVEDEVRYVSETINKKVNKYKKSKYYSRRNKILIDLKNKLDNTF